MSLARRIGAGEVLFGAVVNMANATMVEVCCAAGADFLFLDFEHGLKGLGAMAECLLAADAHRVPVLVRVGERSPNLVARLLDGGAAGLIFPHVRDAAEAAALVSWCRYPPLGRRGSGFSRAELKPGGSPSFEHRQEASREVACIMVIEELAAVDELPAILAVDGVTGVAIGPGDLAMQLGVKDWRDPMLVALLDRMGATVAAHPGKALLRLSLSPEECAAHVAAGTNLVLLNHDVRLVGALYRGLFTDFARAAATAR